MEVEFGYKNFEANNFLEEFVDSKVEQLIRHLEHFHDKPTHLIGHVKKNLRKVEFGTSLTLFLPKQQFHCESKANKSHVSVNEAFAELLEQLDRKKSQFLRKVRHSKLNPEIEE